ncbi:MAG: diacylglycerol/lipid kinase family protein [Polyangiaceae bacterium]
MSGIGVVLNPKSRRNLRDPGAAVRLARRLGDHGVLRSATSHEELYRIAEDFLREDIDVLAISGGDGTGHVTLTGFLDVYRGARVPEVALLRGGTMNTVANSIGVARGEPEGLLARLIRAYARRGHQPLTAVERHVMRIAPAAGGQAHVGFLFGTGVVHGFLAEYYRHGQPTPVVAAKTLARGVASTLVHGETIRQMAEPFRGSVVLDDGTEWPDREYITVAAGTVADLGLGFKPFHRYGERPGAFHMLGIHASALSLVAELPRIRFSLPIREGKAYSALPGRAILRSTSASPGIKYMIDGDLHEVPGRGLAVEIGPRVRLVV